MLDQLIIALATLFSIIFLGYLLRAISFFNGDHLAGFCTKRSQRRTEGLV